MFNKTYIINRTLNANGVMLNRISYIDPRNREDLYEFGLLNEYLFLFKSKGLIQPMRPRSYYANLLKQLNG